MSGKGKTRSAPQGRISLKHQARTDRDPGELYFADGLPAFPDAHRFRLFSHPHCEPFMVLDCLDIAELSFYCIDPFLVCPEYSVTVPGADQEELELSSPDQCMILCLVTVADDPRNFTANLLAPVVVNLETMAACQIILDGQPVRYRIWDGINNMHTDAQAATADRGPSA